MFRYNLIWLTGWKDPAVAYWHAVSCYCRSKCLAHSFCSLAALWLVGWLLLIIECGWAGYISIEQLD